MRKYYLFSFISFLTLFQEVATLKNIKLITRYDVMSAIATQSIISNCFVNIQKNKIKNYVDNKNIIINDNFYNNDIIAKTIKKYDNTTKKSSELLTYDDIMTKTYLFYFVINTIISLIIKLYFRNLKDP